MVGQQSNREGKTKNNIRNCILSNIRPDRSLALPLRQIDRQKIRFFCCCFSCGIHSSSRRFFCVCVRSCSSPRSFRCTFIYGPIRLVWLLLLLPLLLLQHSYRINTFHNFEIIISVMIGCRKIFGQFFSPLFAIFSSSRTSKCGVYWFTFADYASLFVCVSCKNTFLQKPKNAWNSIGIFHFVSSSSATDDGVLMCSGVYLRHLSVLYRYSD